MHPVVVWLGLLLSLFALGFVLYALKVIVLSDMWASRARRRLREADAKWGRSHCHYGACRATLAGLLTPQQWQLSRWGGYIEVDGRTRHWWIGHGSVHCQKHGSRRRDYLCVRPVAHMESQDAETLTLLLWIKTDDRLVWRRANRLG